MSTLSVYTISRAGLVRFLANAAAGGDEFANDGRTFLEVANGGGSSINVTIATQAFNGMALADDVVAVAAGATKRIGPFPKDIYNDANGKVQVTYSAVTNVTVKAVRLPLRGGGAQAWENVAVPNAAFAWLDNILTVQTQGTSFQVVYEAGSLQSHAAIAPVTTYYLDTVAGSDSNNGLSRALPKATWNSVVTAGNATAGPYKVIILTGSTLLRPSSNSTPNQPVEVVGEGTVIWTSTHGLGSWSLAAGKTYTYQANVTGGEYIATVYDETTLNSYGLPTLYAVKTSTTEVENTAGSYYWSGGVLYVHTLDGTSPSLNSGLKYYDNSCIIWAVNKRFYFENITFKGGAINLRNASSAGGAKSYLKNVNIYKAIIAGLDEVVFDGCTLYATNDDGLNYDTLNSRTIYGVEVNCDFGRGGLSNTNQASTSHNGSYMVRIGGHYHDMTGQIVADVGAGYYWMVGCRLHDSATSVAGYIDNGTLWADTCSFTGNLTEAGSGTVYLRDCGVVGTQSGNIMSY